MVVSAIIAYLGDILGTYVGKRRLSVFGLRPRVSALLIAISTGILITLLTLTVAAMLSDNVKIALFSVQQLKKDVSDLTTERARLQGEIETLSNRVRIKEQENVVFRKDEMITTRVIPAGKPSADVTAELENLFGTLFQIASDSRLTVSDKAAFFEENRAQIKAMAEHIATSTIETIVAAIAGENIHVGESLGKVRFQIRPNVLIFHSDQEIASLEVDGTSERTEIARTLRDFMDEINHEVFRLGMIGNPLTERFGDLTSESALSLYDMVNQIKKLGRTLTLVAVVREDTYAKGPLNVSFRIEENPSGE